MAEEIINTFNDEDSERIIRSVRKSEGINTPTPPVVRRPVQVNEYPIVHFQAGGSDIAAFNSSTKQMGSATVRIWDCNSTGALADSGIDVTVYNPGGAFTASKFGVAMYNQAGLLVILVEGCTV